MFVIEEESINRRFSIHRLAHYCLDLSELLKTERVVPVVIFLKCGNQKEQLRLGGDRHSYLEFRFLTCELKGYRQMPIRPAIILLRGSICRIWITQLVSVLPFTQRLKKDWYNLKPTRNDSCNMSILLIIMQI